MTHRVEQLSEDVTLYLGDCRDILPTLGKVDAVVTDPPFEKEAHTPVRRTQKSIRSGVADAIDFSQITEDLRLFVPEWASRKCQGWFLAFCQIEAVSAWRDAMELASLKYKRGMAWIKPDSSPQFNGQGPAQGYECIATAWCGAGVSSWNAGGKRGVYTHCTNGPMRHGVHPTEKPVSLMRELLDDFVRQRGIVVDPFMGSGTTGVACVQLGRKFIGIELEPRYFDIACRRISDELKRPRLDLGEPVAKPVQEVML